MEAKTTMHTYHMLICLASTLTINELNENLV